MLLRLHGTARWLRTSLLSSVCALLLCSTEVRARQVVLIVEPPYADPADAPTRDQLRRADRLQEALLNRMMQLTVENHRPVNGKDANPQMLLDADLVVQVLLQVGGYKYTIHARMYDKARGEWHQLVTQGADHADVRQLVPGIANEILPEIVVRAFELAKPGDRPMLFADCLRYPAEPSTGRQWSVQYGHRLQLQGTLKDRFKVVRLVPTIQPEFYEWWCIDIGQRRPRFRHGDTRSVYGFVEPAPGSNGRVLSLEVQRPDGIWPVVETLEGENMPAALQRITDIVERILQ